MYTIEHARDADKFLNFFLTIAIAFPVFVGIVLFCESRSVARMQQLLTEIIAVLLLVGVYFVLPSDSINQWFAYIYMPIAAVIWAFAFLSAFLKKDNQDDFLKFTYTVIFYGVIFYVLSGIVFIGIMIAIQALGVLFEFRISWLKSLNYLGSIIFGLALPLLILRKVPKQLHDVTEPKVFAIIVRYVSKYVLMPLVALYFLIIYSYALKIIFTATWPEGIVGTMVLAFVTLSLVTMFISYPYYIKSKARHLYTITFSAIIPMAVLLLLAVGVRVSEYGVTESRYYVTLSGLIFIAVSIYYLITRTKFNWKYALIGTMVIFVLTMFGPWSAVGLSKNSQVNRFLDSLTELDLYSNGKIIKQTEPVYYSYKFNEEYNKISRDFNYLQRHYGYQFINKIFNTDYDKWIDSRSFLENELNLHYDYYAPAKVQNQNN